MTQFVFFALLCLVSLSQQRLSILSPGVAQASSVANNTFTSFVVTFPASESGNLTFSATNFIGDIALLVSQNAVPTWTNYQWSATGKAQIITLSPGEYNAGSPFYLSAFGYGNATFLVSASNNGEGCLLPGGGSVFIPVSTGRDAHPLFVFDGSQGPVLITVDARPGVDVFVNGEGTPGVTWPAPANNYTSQWQGQTAPHRFGSLAVVVVAPGQEGYCGLPAGSPAPPSGTQCFLYITLSGDAPGLSIVARSTGDTGVVFVERDAPTVVSTQATSVAFFIDSGSFIVSAKTVLPPSAGSANYTMLLSPNSPAAPSKWTWTSGNDNEGVASIWVDSADINYCEGCLYFLIFQTNPAGSNIDLVLDVSGTEM
jgi:hypothetical protein